MIQLFNIPNYTIDTSRFSNLLHDGVVKTFEGRFADYVGAKYAVSFSSATAAIFLIMKYLVQYRRVWIPSIIPPVVPNAIKLAGVECNFHDNTGWVGSWYRLLAFEDFDIVDSAQYIDKDCFKKICEDNDLMIFSFYPTKPIGSCDGGMVVSNDEKKIERLRELTFNGMSFAENNWDRKLNCIGWKMYMNSIQAYIALENLKKIEDKKHSLKIVRDKYNQAFELNHKSDHLYRIEVDNNDKFIEFAKDKGMICGIHYKALHGHKLYRLPEGGDLLNSTSVSSTTVSIPFHEALTDREIETVIDVVNEYRRRNPS